MSKSIDQYMLEIKREIEEIEQFYAYDFIEISVPEYLWKKGNFEIINKYSPYEYVKSSQENYFEVKASCFDIGDGQFEISNVVMIDGES